MVAEAGKRNTSSVFGFSTDDLLVEKRPEITHGTNCEFF